jgi:SAM-dependent methyltransferase
MRHNTRLLCSIFLLTGLLVGGVGFLQGQQVGGKTIQMKLLLPRSESKFYVDTKIYVDGKEITGQGYDRVLTVSTAKDKDYVEIVAKWEPNNYTKIERPRKVMAKDGNGLIVVDFREKSETEKDDINVRWVPTPDDVVDAMCRMAKVGKNDIVYDLGCGDGIMVVIALKKFDALRGVGIDLDPEMVKKSKMKAQEYSVANKVEFRVGDVLKVDDLSDATVVLLYMGDYINQRLQPILQKTLKPGSRVVSHRFPMAQDWPPDRTEHIRSTSNPGYECDIHLWEIKKK